MLQGIVKQLLVRSKLGCGKRWQESLYAAQVLWSSCKGGWSCLFSFYSGRWILPKKGIWSHRKGIWMFGSQNRTQQTNQITNKQCPPHMHGGYILYHESRVSRNTFLCLFFRYKYRVSQESKHLQPQLKRSGNCLVFHGWDFSNCSLLQTETEHHLTFSCGKVLYYRNSLFLWFFFCPFTLSQLFEFRPKKKEMKIKDMVWNFKLGVNQLFWT